MSEKILICCDRCGQVRNKDGTGLVPVGWGMVLVPKKRHLCPDCYGLLSAWIDRQAELDEKDPTVLVAQP